jgi:hypothetical protein
LGSTTGNELPPKPRIDLPLETTEAKKPSFNAAATHECSRQRCP